MNILPLSTYAIVDDDPAIQQVLCSALNDSGYRHVGNAASGFQAVALVKEKTPQILLLDFHLMDMDGLEVTRQVAALGTTAVVMITGDPNPELARQAMSLGASGYIRKPFEIGQVIAMMESAWHAFQTRHQLKSEIDELNATLEMRKLLEKAKGILMEQQHFTEDEAHKVLQKMSQDQGLSLKEVCRSVIQVKLVLGKYSRKAAS